MADSYLLDTTVASAAWDAGHPRHEDVRSRLEALADDTVFTSSITLGEVEYGLAVAPAINAVRQAAVRKAMSTFYVLDVDRHTAEPYGVIRGELFKRHAPRDMRGRVAKKRVEDLTDRTSSKELGIQENDLWIVSVAVQYNIRLVTFDRRMEPILDAARATLSYDRALFW